MGFPHFLTLPPSTAGGALETTMVAGDQNGSSSTKLALHMQRQVQSEWCWAAVTASVAVFYRPASSWTQCGVADATLGRQDCCTTGGADQERCNKPYFLDVALEVIGHFQGMEARVLAFDEILGEIGQGRPVCCRIEWQDRTGHFLSIIDCFTGPSGETYLRLADPIFLETQIVLRDFASGYQTGAAWTHSYRTTGAAAGGARVAAARPASPRYSDAIGA